MQLRVARLCLDCEELHTDSSCPRCTSCTYVFVSKWLPVEERRRWRRPVDASHEGRWSGGSSLVGMLRRWWVGEPEAAPLTPLTRAADRVAALKLDELGADRSGSHQEIDLRPREPGMRKA